MTARPFLLEKDLAGKRVLVIFACWGLSSCLIEKGRILGGKNSLIGEIGHMIIDPSDPETCGCGSHGCLERLVSRRPGPQYFAAAGGTFPRVFPAAERSGANHHPPGICRLQPGGPSGPFTWSITWPGPCCGSQKHFPGF